MTFWFLKPSRDVSKRNPPEDVHVAVESQTDVLALHHTSICVHHPELQKSHTTFLYFIPFFFLKCNNESCQIYNYIFSNKMYLSVFDD